MRRATINKLIMAGNKPSCIKLNGKRRIPAPKAALAKLKDAANTDDPTDSRLLIESTVPIRVRVDIVADAVGSVMLGR